MTFFLAFLDICSCSLYVLVQIQFAFLAELLSSSASSHITLVHFNCIKVGSVDVSARC